MTIILHATPYGYYDNFAGFYFSDLDDYQAKYDAAYKAHGCEEYEIQFIDGSDAAGQLASAMHLSQANLPEYFDNVGKLDDSQLVAFLWLVGDRGRTVPDALERLDDVCLFEGSVKDYAEEFIESRYAQEIPEFALRYFDYDAYARDLELGGDVDTITVDGVDYVITNANDF